MLITAHLTRINKIARLQHARRLLYRAFYYDAKPYLEKGHLPVSGHGYRLQGKTDRAIFQLACHDNLRRTSVGRAQGELRPRPGLSVGTQTEDTQQLLKNERTSAI
ncbi:MAG: hypothetical protein M5U35_00095 [Roseovarius sp.]|nr:hypothetical protein [Roseovarius sp.]